MISGTDIKLALSALSELVKKGMTVEAQEKVMELREMLLDLREQNVDLRHENSELKKKLEKKESIFFEGGVYWAKKDDGTKDGPFCPTCHDNNGKFVRLGDNGEDYYCNVKVCGFQKRYKGDGSGIVTEGRRMTADLFDKY